MIANYHTHTARCNHAEGADRAYVESALSAGLKILGFSDHSPCPFPGDYKSWHRMKLEEMEGYVQSVLSLRKEFEGQIQIPLGLELEHYPDRMPELLPILRDYPIDYLLLGQHFLGNEIGEAYSGNVTGDRRVLERYCDQAIEGMETGLFTYFAHPDLIHYVGEDSVYLPQMRRLCRAAKACSMPLEWNLLGMTQGRHYPERRFWEVAAEENCDVIIGWDAHKPQVMEDPEPLQRAERHIRELGMHLLETVPLRNL